MVVSIVIVTWQSKDVLPACLASIRQQEYDGEVEVVVWDNNSTDGTLDFVRPEASRTRVLPSPENVGFARANNAAARASTGDLLVFLNPDTILPRQDVLRQWIAAHGARRDIGISAPRLLNSDGSIQPSVARFTSPSSTLVLGLGIHRLMRGRLRERWAPPDGSPVQRRDVDWVKGAAVMISRDLFFAVGGWDEGAFMYAEDQDLCWSVRRSGYRVVFDPDIEIIHLDDHAANQRWSDVERSARVAQATAGMLRKRYRPGTRILTLCLLTVRHGIRAGYFRIRGQPERAAAHLAFAKVFAQASWEIAGGGRP